MKKVYVVHGYDYVAKEVYATKELAEKACKAKQRAMECGGYHVTLGVKELTFIEE